MAATVLIHLTGQVLMHPLTLAGRARPFSAPSGTFTWVLLGQLAMDILIYYTVGMACVARAMLASPPRCPACS